MIIDLLFLLVAGFGFYKGYNSGILRTVFWVLSFMLGLFVALRYSVGVTEVLQRLFNTDHSFMFIAGFILSFMMAMFFVRMLAKLLEKLLQDLNVNVINRLAGAAVYSFILTLIYSFILWILVEAQALSKTQINESFTYPYLKTFPAQTREFWDNMQPVFRDFWQESGEVMKNSEQQ